ncbi:MAG: FGGY-family carbohydrate kinase [Mesorhizobium sp.]
MGLYLGIDIGTFESKGVLVDHKGKVKATASRRHKMLVPQPGWAEHRPRQDWWGAFCQISKALLAESRADPRSIRAVAASAIGPCMLPVDGNGEALANAVLYGVDTRAAVEIELLEREIGRDTVFSRTGNALTSQSVGPKILWLKRHSPEVFVKARSIVTSTTYLVEKLTGEVVIDHYSAANFAPFYMIDRQAWSDELAPGILPMEKLPRLSWSSEIAGRVTRKAAHATGLAAGTPVTAGTIDAAAEAVSVGVTKGGDMMLMYGSTVFMILLTAARLADPRLWYAPWLFPGQHASMAGLATSGTLTHWFREVAARELEADQAFAELAREAARVPAGARGLVMLPYFSGERTPIHDPHAKGVLFGLNLTHGRGDIYRALLEGIALGTRAAFEAYGEAGALPRRLRAVGGGTRNAVWAQATSDASGYRQEVCRVTIGAAYGDAFLAALAVGDVSKRDIGGWNPVVRRIVPDRRTKAVYDRNYSVFQSLTQKTRAEMAALDAPLI